MREGDARSIQKNLRTGAVVLSIALGVFVVYVTLGAQAQTAPSYKYDPDWPKPLPNKWKMGGVTGLAVTRTTTSGCSTVRTT